MINDVLRGAASTDLFDDFDSLRFAVYGALVRHLEQSGYVRTTPFDASFDTGLTINDIDLEKVDDFFRRARMAKKLTIPSDADAEWLLKKLDAVSDDGKISNAAVLLFSKEPQRKFLASEVKCLQYWGRDVVGLPNEQRRICEILIGNPRTTIRKIASTLDVRPRTVEKQIAALKTKGVLVREGGTRGFWKVTLRKEG